MPCSVCRQAGHNRATCPTITSNEGRQLQRTTLGVRWTERSSGPVVLQRDDVLQRADALQRASRLRQLLENTSAPITFPSVRRLWIKATKSIINIQRYSKIVLLNHHLYPATDEPLIFYNSWLKVRTSTREVLFRPRGGHLWWVLGDDYSTNTGIFQCVDNSCRIFYRTRNPYRESVLKDELRIVKLVNLRKENYLIYWVVGNYMVQDIDNQVNGVKYMGFMPKDSTFDLKTLNGHRFYLVPNRLNTEPPYHPERDNQFFIEPYCQLNIHDKLGDKVYIDNKEELSELNKWKFNALKLDYLIREVIKLGGKNNDVLESVLDLHEDIELESCSEWFKDIAGVPSTFTNIT